MYYEVILTASAWALGHLGSGHWLSEGLRATHNLFGSMLRGTQPNSDINTPGRTLRKK